MNVAVLMKSIMLSLDRAFALTFPKHQSDSSLRPLQAEKVMWGCYYRYRWYCDVVLLLGDGGNSVVVLVEVLLGRLFC